MDFNGGSPFFCDSGVKKEDVQGLFDAEPCLIGNDGGYYANFVDNCVNNDINNHNRSVRNISERGDDTKCCLNVAVPPSCLTTSAGISPSALLESPVVMIPNDQGKTNDLCMINNQTTDMNDEVVRERIANPNPEKRHKGSLGLLKIADDGYCWRKYGQKDVKRSQLPRSYYRCCTMNCPMKKFVERSIADGSIIQIIYKGGRHNHPEPGKNGCVKTEVEGSSSSNLDLGDDDPTYEQLESNLDLLSPSLVADEEDEGGAPSDSRKRKRDIIFPSEDALERSSRDPRVIVQVKSETTILDDGYRWRKYGQKVVKGNHNPRSYYKCTTQGCPVRKQVERASNDATSVITTYDGKHTHEVPSNKNNGNLTIASTNNTIAASPKRDFSRSPSNIIPPYNPPLFDYNEFMNANLPLNIIPPPATTTTGNLNLLPFSPSPSYCATRQFPHFHSLPCASSSNLNLSNNGNKRTYQSSSSSSPYSSYPMIPDFMMLPTQINHRVPGLMLPNFGFSNNNYAPIQTLSLSGQNLQAQQSTAVQLKNNEGVRSTDGV